MTHLTVTPLMLSEGRDVVITRASGDSGTYNPATGEYTPDTPLDSATMRGVYISYKDSEIDNARVLARDRKLLLDATSASYTPKVGDVVDSATTPALVVDVHTIAPNGVPVAYICQVRE